MIGVDYIESDRLVTGSRECYPHSGLRVPNVEAKPQSKTESWQETSPDVELSTVTNGMEEQHLSQQLASLANEVRFPQCS